MKYNIETSYFVNELGLSKSVVESQIETLNTLDHAELRKLSRIELLRKKESLHNAIALLPGFLDVAIILAEQEKKFHEAKKAVFQNIDVPF